MSKKLTPEQKVKRALEALDVAVQEWYAENNPKDKTHYANPTIADYEEIGHISRITLQGPNGTWVDLTSSKHKYNGD